MCRAHRHRLRPRRLPAQGAPEAGAEGGRPRRRRSRDELRGVGRLPADLRGGRACGLRRRRRAGHRARRQRPGGAARGQQGEGRARRPAGRSDHGHRERHDQGGRELMTDPLDELERTDPTVADIVRRELERQNTTIQLIASENFTSPAVLAAQGSVLTNKYSEGYPRKRYYGGNYVVDEAEELARDRACALFGAEHANVQPHSGANANQAAYMALLEPGDKVMGMRLDQGGHLTHGSPVNFSGRMYDFVAYGVDEDTECLDYDVIAALARAERPKA